VDESFPVARRSDSLLRDQGFQAMVLSAMGGAIQPHTDRRLGGPGTRGSFKRLVASARRGPVGPAIPNLMIDFSMSMAVITEGFCGRGVLLVIIGVIVF
jgi:hypothetical protein